MSSDDIVLRINNLSKCYQIYQQKHHRLLQTLFHGRKQFYKEFWALRDISLQVRRGECIGILGRNGSGKSTLLQIIAGTLAPTTGQVEIYGRRLAALLELGSGFNPEFTGRENVYMNGTVLGLTKREIDQKFDQIAEYADIGDFINQPTKTYSSGMVVRLAFAVQVLVEPDFLIVDEALAVGDAAFQMKCMARMHQLMEKGTTVLLVSHSVQTIRTFCNRAIWLHQGQIREAGPAPDITSQYMEFLFSGSNTAITASPGPKAPAPAETTALPIDHPGRKEPLRRWGSGEIQITHFAMVGDQSGFTPVFEHLEHITVSFDASVIGKLEADRIAVAMALRDTRGIDIIAVSSVEHQIFWESLDPGETIQARFEFENIINPGEYMLILAVEYFQDGKRKYADYVENACLVQMASDRHHYGLVEPRIRMTINKSAAECLA